jgi:hypothetical protein
VWFGKFLCFIFYCLTCNRTPIFLFKHTNWIISCSYSLKCSCLESQEDFWLVFMFIGFCFSTFLLHCNNLLSWHKTDQSSIHILPLPWKNMFHTNTK